MRLLAEIIPKPHHYQEATDAILAIINQTRAEPGCHRFDLYTSKDGTRLYLDEIWADKRAFDNHHAQSYTQAVFTAYETWLAEPPRLMPLTPIDTAER